MDRNINIVDDNGNTFTVEVVRIFNVNGYDNDYILYTMNKELDNDDIEAYVSILLKENGNYRLINIDDEQEWDIVQKAIEEMGEMEDE